MANNLTLTKPVVGGSRSTWGALLNTIIDTINSAFGDTTVIADNTGTVVLTTDQHNTRALRATGTGAGGITLHVKDGVGKDWLVVNDRPSGSVTVRCAAGGLSVIVPVGTRYLVQSDGTNCYRVQGAFDQDLNTTDTVQFAAINLGHATDTTLARIAAGRVSIEGVEISTASNTLTLSNKSLTAPVITGAAVFANTSLNVLDTNSTHVLGFRVGSNLTLDRSLTFTTGDASRTLTLSADVTLNQNVHTTATPLFAGVAINTPIPVAPFVVSDAANPGHIGFEVSPNSAIAGAVRVIAVNRNTPAVVPMTLQAEYVAIVGPLRADPGSAGSPSLSFDGDPNTGFYNPSGDSIGISTGGAFRGNFSTSGLTMTTATSAQVFGVDAHAYINTDGSIAATKAGNPPLILSRLTNTGGVADFYDDTTFSGNITVNGATAAYNTSSDERLKEFIEFYDGKVAITLIRQDPVRRFRWNAYAGEESEGKEAVGWFSQHSYLVSKDLASVGHGKPGDKGFRPWGVDQGKRTPYLWAATIYLADRADEHESRIAANENRIKELQTEIDALKERAA